MKETLEEAAKRYYEENIDQSDIPREHYEWEIQELMVGFANTWQQKTSYNEKELFKFIAEILQTPSLRDGSWEDIDEWFKQFKK